MCGLFRITGEVLRRCECSSYHKLVQLYSGKKRKIYFFVFFFTNPDLFIYIKILKIIKYVFCNVFCIISRNGKLFTFASSPFISS